MGAFESKISSPYYAIIDENPSEDSSEIKIENSCNVYNEEQSNSVSQTLWSIKKVKFKNENKKTLLFEFETNDEKKKIQLALNQIKVKPFLKQFNLIILIQF